MKSSLLRSLVLAAVILVCNVVRAGTTIPLASPDGRLAVELGLNQQGQITWSAKLAGVAALEPAPLGWVVRRQRPRPARRLRAAATRHAVGSYPVFGLTATYLTTVQKPLCPSPLPARIGVYAFAYLRRCGGPL